MNQIHHAISQTTFAQFSNLLNTLGVGKNDANNLVLLPSDPAVAAQMDAIVRDKPPGDKSGNTSKSGELSDTSEPEGQELLYSARVALDETQMEVEGKLVNLAPGMAVTVEIKTGRRRIIEYLMSPLLRYRQESLRER